MTEQRAIADLWQRIRRLNEIVLQEDPTEFFKPPRAEKTISAVEKALGFALPPELRASYAVHDEVTQPWEDCAFFDGVEQLPATISGYTEWAKHCPAFRCAVGTRPPVFGPRLVPFAFGNETAFCMDLDPGEGGKPGQIVGVCFGDATSKVVAGGFVEFLEQGIKQLEAALAKKKRRK